MLGGRIIACSPSEMLLASYLPRWRDIALVENGVDDIACKLPSLGSGESNKIVVVSVGRLTSQKDPESFFRLAREMPHLEFVWVGDGDIRPISDSWPDNLHITGWVEKTEIYGFLVNADIFCMLSHWEGMPLALLEAMLIGLPVVVSNIGGCHEVVEDGVSGFVCDNYEAAFSSLKILANDTSKINEMGTAARNRALNRYLSERMCDEVYKTYSC